MKCPICGEWWNIHTNTCPNNHNCAELIGEIERLKKDLPILLSCLRVLWGSGVRGYEIKRALEIVEGK